MRILLTLSAAALCFVACKKQEAEKVAPVESGTYIQYNMELYDKDQQPVFLSDADSRVNVSYKLNDQELHTETFTGADCNHIKINGNFKPGDNKEAYVKFESNLGKKGITMKGYIYRILDGGVKPVASKSDLNTVELEYLVK